LCGWRRSLPGWHWFGLRFMDSLSGGCFLPQLSSSAWPSFSLALRKPRRRCERAAALYDQGLAVSTTFGRKGATGERFLNSAHPYAQDLDLFGHGSLFELLSTARTRVGEETLARWLLAPATPDVLRDRQAAVAELRPRLDLREDLALLGEGIVPAMTRRHSRHGPPPRVAHLQP